MELDVGCTEVPTTEVAMLERSVWYDMAVGLDRVIGALVVSVPSRRIDDAEPLQQRMYRTYMCAPVDCPIDAKPFDILSCVH